MAGKRQKSEIITFKADEALSAAMSAVPNRSAFIRSAVLAALENVCPMCAGMGTLTPNQKRHWEALAADHAVEECRRCHEVRLVCSRKGPRAARRGGSKAC